MKPFNLEEALAGKPVITRSGKKVTNLTLFKNNEALYPLVGFMEGDDVPTGWTLDGSYDLFKFKNEDDLVMTTATKKGYINLYKQGEHNRTVSDNLLADSTSVMKTEEDAKKLAKLYPAIAVAVPVEWEE